MSTPRTTKAWTVEGAGSFDCLKLDKEHVLPALSDNEVLVKFHAASLNYRDIIIALVTTPSCASSAATANPPRATILSQRRQTSFQAPTELEKLWQLVLKSLALKKGPRF